MEASGRLFLVVGALAATALALTRLRSRPGRAAEPVEAAYATSERSVLAPSSDAELSARISVTDPPTPVPESTRVETAKFEGLSAFRGLAESLCAQEVELVMAGGMEMGSAGFHLVFPSDANDPHIMNPALFPWPGEYTVRTWGYWDAEPRYELAYHACD